MKKILIYTFLFLVFYNAKSQPSGFTAVKDINSVSEKIKKSSLETKTLDSDFKQYKHLSILTKDIESVGHFSFKAENKVRWQYTVPYNYLIVMSNGKMWIKTDKKVQTYDTNSNKVFKEINDLMVGMLQGKILSDPNFKTKYYENSTTVLAILIPQKPDLKEFLNEIHIYFSKTDYSVSILKMLENSDDYTLINFLNQKKNIEISDSKFSVK
jgi:outer membrane lipoprotein-sorting protein